MRSQRSEAGAKGLGARQRERGLLPGLVGESELPILAGCTCSKVVLGIKIIKKDFFNECG